MLKNFQNNHYYEIAVISIINGDILNKYVTMVPFMESEHIIYRSFMSFLQKKHGDDIYILWNERYGNMPNNINEIKIVIPTKPTFKYNK